MDRLETELGSLYVSMHLMVLGASRLIGAVLAGTLADRSQCT